MKIEKNKSKKSIGELPILTQNLIKTLLSCPEDELFKHLASVTVWRYGKCELYHWIDVLDRFDSILSKVTHYSSTSTCLYMCPAIREPKTKALILAVLDFTCLLIEHSYARHIYNSTEHLCVLLATPDLDIVLAVLNLLYIFGKRSNYISRLPAQQRSDLNSYLEYLGESWGGKQNGFGLAQCCEDVPLDKFPSTSTSVYFEYQPLNNEEEQSSSFLPHIITTRSIVLTSVDKVREEYSIFISTLLPLLPICLSLPSLSPPSLPLPFLFFP
jgi:E3 ubiquitin-protein ligase HUWE1